MTHGDAYYWKNKYEDCLEEKLRQQQLLEQQQLIIDKYQKHYAKHTFKRKAWRLQLQRIGFLWRV